MTFPIPSSSRWQSFSDQLPPISPSVAKFLFAPDNNGVQRCLGTQKQTSAGYAALKAFGYPVANLHYALGQATYGPDAGQPDSNAVQTIVNGTWGSRWSQYKNLNYLFLLSTVAGNPRIHNGQEKWWLLDLNSSTCFGRIYADLLADIAAVPGTGGVFLDEFIPLNQSQMDVEDPRFYGSAAADPAAWAPLPSWTQQQQTWLTSIVNGLHQHGLWVVANLGHLCLGWPNYSPPTGADAVMVEQFCNRGLYQGSDWVLAMNRCLTFAHAGTPLILQSAASEVDRSFFFASVLLLDSVLPNLCDGNSAAPYWWPEMEWVLQSLGEPDDVPAVLGQNPPGCYIRHFSEGMVMVNPGTAPIPVQFSTGLCPLVFTGGGLLADTSLDASGNYQGGKMIVGSPVSSVTLQPGTGMILLAKTQPVPTPTRKATVVDEDGTVWSGMLTKQG